MSASSNTLHFYWESIYERIQRKIGYYSEKQTEKKETAVAAGVAMEFIMFFFHFFFLYMLKFGVRPKMKGRHEQKKKKNWKSLQNALIYLFACLFLLSFFSRTFSPHFYFRWTLTAISYMIWIQPAEFSPHVYAEIIMNIFIYHFNLITRRP